MNKRGPAFVIILVFIALPVLAAGTPPQAVTEGSTPSAGTHFITAPNVTVVTASPRADRVNAVLASRAALPSGETWVASKAIIFDEATKSLRKPTAAETALLVRSLRELTSRRTAASKPVAMEGGGLRASLDGELANIVIARATADGVMETRCVQTFEEAAEFLGLVQQPSTTSTK